MTTLVYLFEAYVIASFVVFFGCLYVSGIHLSYSRNAFKAMGWRAYEGIYRFSTRLFWLVTAYIVLYGLLFFYFISSYRGMARKPEAYAALVLLILANALALYLSLRFTRRLSYNVRRLQKKSA